MRGDDEKRGSSEEQPVAQARHDHHDPRGQVDEGGEAVEDREHFEVVPGHETHNYDDCQCGNYDPQGDGDPVP